MKTLKLYGAVAEEFGSDQYTVDAPSPFQAVRGLYCGRPKIKEMIRSGIWKIIKGDVEVDDRVDESELHMGTQAEVLHLVPVVQGSGDVGRIILGAVLIVVDVVFLHTGYLTSLGIALALGGVAGLLTPKPKMNGDPNPSDQRQSLMFNGPVNTMEQGGPVPLVYGLCLTGSTIVSAGVNVEQT